MRDPRLYAKCANFQLHVYHDKFLSWEGHDVRSTRHIITQSLWLLCGEVANINFMIFGFIRPLLARTIQRIRDGYDSHYTTDVDLQEKYVQLV